MERNSKIALVVIVAFVIIASTFIYLNFYQIGQEFLPITTETRAVTAGGAEIAEKNLKFFEDMRKPDGFYFIGENCQYGGACEKLEPPLYFNGLLISAYKALYEATGNQEYLQKYNQEFDTMINLCKNPNADCSVIYTPVYEKFQSTGDRRYSDFLLERREKVETIMQNQTFGKRTLDNRKYLENIKYFTFVYRITGDESALESAKSSTIEIFGTDLPEETSLRVFGRVHVYPPLCASQLAKLEIFAATGDRSFLDSVVKNFDMLKVSENLDVFDNTLDLMACSEALLKVHEITGNRAYYDEAVEVVGYTIKNYWDSPVNQKGDGREALLLTNQNTFNLKAISNNALSVIVLSKMKNERFEL